jgi:hypothetical protein
MKRIVFAALSCMLLALIVLPVVVSVNHVASQAPAVSPALRADGGAPKPLPKPPTRLALGA